MCLKSGYNTDPEAYKKKMRVMNFYEKVSTSNDNIYLHIKTNGTVQQVILA